MSSKLVFTFLSLIFIPFAFLCPPSLALLPIRLFLLLGAATRASQPAIVSASSDEANKQYLRLFAKYLDTQGGTFDTFYDTLSAHTDYQTGAFLMSILLRMMLLL